MRPPAAIGAVLALAARPVAAEVRPGTPPGDHGCEFVRARLERSRRFLGDALKP